MMEKFIGDNKSVFHQPFGAKQEFDAKQGVLFHRVIPKAMKNAKPTFTLSNAIDMSIINIHKSQFHQHVC